MYLGIDVGGTTTKYVILDDNHHVIHSFIKDSKYVGDSFRAELVREIERLISIYPDVDMIGIGIPGVIDMINQKVVEAPALDVQDLDLVSYIEDRFEVNVVMDNDVNAWTLAEANIGAGVGIENFVMITIGTGIGAGIFINGNIYRGKNYSAGEIGYFPLGIDAYDKAMNGQEFGYFEAIASAYGIRTKYEALKYGNSDRFDVINDTKSVFKFSKVGDKVAKGVVENALDYIGLGLSQVICLLQPEKIIIGGGLSQEGDALLNAIQERIEKLVPFRTRLELSKLDTFGGAIGTTYIKDQKHLKIKN